jgi:hypothetical protein
MFCAPGPIFGGTEGVRSCFHVLRFRTCFRRYRGRRLPFSSFAHPNSFAAVPTASSLVFMYCTPRHIFGGAEGVRSGFHVLRSRTHFRQFRGRRVQFPCFALPYSFSAIPAATYPVFMFCAPALTTVPRASGPVFMFALLDSFSTVLRTSGPVFMFCAPGLIFDNTGGVGSHIHVLHARTRFRRYRRRRVPFSCFELPDSFFTVPRASATVFMFYAS